jgi:hypothetical protein
MVQKNKKRRCLKISKDDAIQIGGVLKHDFKYFNKYNSNVSYININNVLGYYKNNVVTITKLIKYKNIYK